MKKIIMIFILSVICFGQFTKQDTLDYVNKAILKQYGEEIKSYYQLSVPANGIGYFFDWTHPTIPKPTKVQLLKIGKKIYLDEQAVVYLKDRAREYPKKDDIVWALFLKEMGSPGQFNVLRDSTVRVIARYKKPEVIK